MAVSTCLLCFRENAVRDETVPESAVQNSGGVRNGNLKTTVSLYIFFNKGIYFLSHSIVTKWSVS